MNLRATGECAMFCLLADIAESIDDDSHENIHEPEVEQDQTHYEEEAGHEILGIDHLIHEIRPSIRWNSRYERQVCGMSLQVLTSCDNYNLQKSSKDIVEALCSVVGIVLTLRDRSLALTCSSNKITHYAQLS
jgi:hypothetical protein